jgi:quinol monooxygenase YgiN
VEVSLIYPESRRHPKSKEPHAVIFIAVKFTVRPEHSDDWLVLVHDFTTATRQEPGNVFFEWSSSMDTPHQFVLLEAFESAEAGEKHVSSDHFKAAMESLSDVIAETPHLINVEASGGGWGKMAELEPAGGQ